MFKTAARRGIFVITSLYLMMMSLASLIFSYGKETTFWNEFLTGNLIILSTILSVLILIQIAGMIAIWIVNRVIRFRWWKEL